VASDLDLHALIVAHNPPDLEIEPLQSAEEVIKEIDDLMQVFQPPRHLFEFKKTSFRDLFYYIIKDPSSPEMSENMHQSPDTPECAMPYRLSNAIHQESQSTSFPPLLSDFVSLSTIVVVFVCRVGNVERWPAE
jgi:hypothetical protein